VELIFKFHFFIIFRRNSTIKELQINEQIRDPQVRLVGEGGEQLGIMSAKQANALADEQGLDLVKISPNATPPVCKLMNYGKFKYEQAKKQQEARKKQRESMTEIKGMRLGLQIGEHDMNFKAKNVIGFLQDGDKVKVSIRLRGREMAYAGKAIDIMLKFADLVKEHAVIESRPMQSGYYVSMVLAPQK
jgi:translation initiation factor IF-3